MLCSQFHTDAGVSLTKRWSVPVVNRDHQIRICGSGVRISSGAPFPYKTANVWTRGLVPSDHLFQGCLVPNDANRVVVDLDPIHNRPDVSLPELDRPCRDVLPHYLPKALNCLGIEGVQLWMNGNSGERVLGPVPVRFKGRYPVLQDIVQLGQAIFDHGVEPP